MSLGQNLEKALYNNNISKTKFSKNIDVSKSYLLRIISGEKPCSEKMFHKIISSSLLSNSDKIQISDEYFSIQYGHNDFEKIKFLFELLSAKSNYTETKDYYVRTELFDSYFSTPNKSFVIGNSIEFVEIVHFFLQRNIHKDDFFLYTNFSFSHKDLDEFLLSFFSEIGVQNNTSFDIVHLVDINEMAEKKNFDYMFSIFKWLSIGINTLYKHGRDNFDSDLFPYYIITNSALITFNKDGSQGIILTDENIINYHVKNFKKLQGKYSPCTKQYFDEVQFMFDLDNVKFKRKNTVLDGYICCGHLLSEELLNECASKNIPEELKQQLIPAILEHYNIYKKNVKQYATMKSYRDFAKTGKYMAISENYMPPLPTRWRVYLFEKMINCIKKVEELESNQANKITITENNPLDDISYIINDELFNFPENMNIAIIDNSVMLSGIYYETKSDNTIFSYNYSVTMNIPNMARIFSLFFDYLERNDFILNNETSINFLEECISTAKQPRGIVMN